MATKSKFLLLLIVLVSNYFTGLKAQENIQRKQLFDSDWKFFQGDKPEAYAANYNDNSWHKLDLPHDWSIGGIINTNNPMGNDGGYFPSGIGWYRKSFKVPARWKDKCVSIYFEGVYMNSEVFINGKSLGMHPYGYTPFSYDLTPYLDFTKENILSVRVDNSKQKNCRWYSGSGIYRHVWVLVKEPVHFTTWGTAITTPFVSLKKATVEVKTHIRNETDQEKKIVLNTLIFGESANNIGNNQLKIKLSPNSEREVNLTLNVTKPLLWTPESPNLYRSEVQILEDKKVIDNVEIYFGIRSIKFSPENGFQLNGKTVKINGGCVHHDNGCLGAAAFDRAEERRVELLKEAGFNAIRTSHNPPSEAFLDACDRLGLMVIDEAFDGWKEQKNQYDYAQIFNDWCQRDLESMILRDRNHPSVIMWSIGNEIIERKKPEAVETAKILAGYAHQTDPTRPVTSAMTTWDKDWEVFDSLMAAHDICGYNYQLHRAMADHERVPSRVIVQTESYPRDAFANWELVQNNNYIIGDFVWTALDYLGESGIGRWYYTGDVTGEHWERPLFPWHGAYCGDIDLIGWRKPISHYRSMLYTNNEKLFMAVREPNPEPYKIIETMWSVWPTWESWTWPGLERKDLQVDVYSRYPEVRLYLNDSLLGEQYTGEKQQFKATFIVPYIPGKLKAVGVIDNKEMETTMLKTSGNATIIHAKADRAIILANGQDLSFVSIEITDSNGILQPNAENRLQFNVQGPGVIIGVDNANVKDTDSYAGNTRKAWHGRALVVIRSTQDTGDIKLNVTSQGLTDSNITIKAVR